MERLTLRQLFSSNILDIPLAELSFVILQIVIFIILLYIGIVLVKMTKKK